MMQLVVTMTQLVHAVRGFAVLVGWAVLLSAVSGAIAAAAPLTNVINPSVDRTLVVYSESVDATANAEAAMEGGQ